MPHTPDFTGQAHFSPDNQVCRKRSIQISTDECCGHSEIRRRLKQTNPPCHIDENVILGKVESQFLLENRQQKRQSVTVDPHAGAPGLKPACGTDQCLQFDQKGARSFYRTNDNRSGHPFGAFRKKQLGRIGDFLKPRLLHFKNPHLIGRTVPVLHRTQQAKCVSPISFQIDDGVHQVLECTRTGDRAFLGDMSDQKDSDVSFLCFSHQP
jgi:hypothetical protein